MAPRVKRTPEEKLELAQKVYTNFKLLMREETRFEDVRSYYFYKIASSRETEDFQSMEDGLKVLEDWLKMKVISIEEKLDLINLLMRAPLPHTLSSNLNQATKRITILRKWNNVTASFTEILKNYKEVLKPRYIPPFGEL